MTLPNTAPSAEAYNDVTHIAPLIKVLLEHERNKESIMMAQTESHTRLHGRWLLIARLAWTIGFITLTLMYALGFLAARDAFSTVCKEELCTLRQQIRHTDAGDQVMSWPGPPIGYANRLHQDQVEALERFGLTLDQYGWLASLQVGLPVLVFLLIAAGLFWRKSDDWMVLFASIMVATIPVGNGPLLFMLVVNQPAWEWVFDSVSVVALSCFLIFPLIFPTGRFVPRWTRWMALFEIAGAVIIIFFPNSFLEGTKKVVAIYVALSFVTGVYAQLYRYFRVASPVERQQLKWVIVGLAGFISITLLVLLPLNALLVYRATGMDPARALALSVIPDTIFQVILLFIPISIAISVLRYRLWDIDIIISRTLVYGTLSVGIVMTYILLVGLLGTLFNTHVSLAAALLTAALIIPFFQPLRLRLQRAVNRLTFGGRDVASPKQEIEESQPDSEMPLRPRWREVAQSAWFICMVLAAIVLIGTVPIYYSHISHPFLSDPYNLGQYNIPLQVLAGVSDLVSGFISFALAILLFWRKPNDRMALFASFFFLITSVASNDTLDHFLMAYAGTASTREIYRHLQIPLWILLFCIFPDGRFVPRWTRWVFLFSILASFSFLVSSEGRFVEFTAGLPFFLVTYYAQVYRYRHVSSDVERQQTKWVVLGWLVVIVLSVIASLIYRRPSGPLINILPLIVAMAILRYRLWDIDLILNRAMVYGALTTGIVAFYILLVGALSLLSQSTGNLLISLLATGLIAFLFQPLRERLQRGVNRLIYGERDDPYVALSRLGRRLEASLAPEAVLPTVVTTVREVLKLPYVAIYLKHEDGNKIAAESASRSLHAEGGRIRVPGMEREGLCVPLIHQGETLGYIVLGPRAPNESFSSTDLRLLDDLAPQVGVAVHSVRLTADLQRSREQLVLAREEERRRLRRDLHDGLGPQLAGLTLKLETVRNRLTDDPVTDSLLADLTKRTQEATADIRRLVYELRPPTLDELGLVSALREGAAQYSQQGANGVNITFDAPESLPALPAAVEVAVYRIAQEALTNIVRHADARNCLVRIRLDEPTSLLCLEVQDDGKGLPVKRRAGVGLNSIRERAEELGGTWTIESIPTGGTRILVRLPCRLPDTPASLTPKEE